MAVFPVTDFKHPVLTPAMILIGQYLSQSPVRGPRDAIAGVLLSGIALSGVRPSGRIFPEAVTFLHGIVAHACRYMLKGLYMMLIGLYTVSSPMFQYFINKYAARVGSCQVYLLAYKYDIQVSL